MTEHEQNSPRGWYPADGEPGPNAAAWYGASIHAPTPPDVPDPEEDAKAAKKRRRTRIVAIVLCAALLLGAVGSVLTRSLLRAVPAMEIVSGGIQKPSASENVVDSYRDYFSQTYTGSTRVSIPRTDADADVRLTLHAAAEAEPLSLQAIYEAVSPAVVGVTATRDGQDYSWGSGVMFTADGYLVTNTHIIAGCDGAYVTFSDGGEFEALLIGEDEQSDIAVLKIEGEDFPIAEFGNSDELRVGDPVAAIGNPLGAAYAGTMTNGIVSGIDRSIQKNGHTMTLLQTNAALNEGSSGGALLNERGQVVGITSMKIMSMLYATVEGIGFAIPSATVKEVADALIAQGAVTGHPSLGITAAPVDTQAQAQYGLPAGVYVATVSEASRSSLRVGDIITEADGTPVSSVAEVNAVKDGFAVGDTFPLTVWRDGEIVRIDSVLVDSADVQ